MLFCGTLRWMCYVDGMAKFLASQGVLLKDFGAYAERLSARVKAHAHALATDANRPFEYLASSQLRKEAHARMIAERDGITAGLVCVLSCVEPAGRLPFGGIGPANNSNSWRASGNVSTSISISSMRISG